MSNILIHFILLYSSDDCQFSMTKINQNKKNIFELRSYNVRFIIYLLLFFFSFLMYSVVKKKQKMPSWRLTPFLVVLFFLLTFYWTYVCVCVCVFYCKDLLITKKDDSSWRHLKEWMSINLLIKYLNFRDSFEISLGMDEVESNKKYDSTGSWR